MGISLAITFLALNLHCVSLPKNHFQAMEPGIYHWDRLDGKTWLVVTDSTVTYCVEGR